MKRKSAARMLYMVFGGYSDPSPRRISTVNMDSHRANSFVGYDLRSKSSGHLSLNILEFLAATHELKTLTAHFVFFSVFLGIYPLAYSAASASVTAVLKRFRGCKGLRNFLEAQNRLLGHS